MQEGSSVKAYDSFIFIPAHYFTLYLDPDLSQRPCLRKNRLFPALSNSRLIQKGSLLILHPSDAKAVLISRRSIRIKAEPVPSKSLPQESDSPRLLKSLPVKKMLVNSFFIIFVCKLILALKEEGRPPIRYLNFFGIGLEWSL
jgi:hypothetical protein